MRESGGKVVVVLDSTYQILLFILDESRTFLFLCGSNLTYSSLVGSCSCASQVGGTHTLTWFDLWLWLTNPSWPRRPLTNSHLFPFTSLTKKGRSIHTRIARFVYRSTNVLPYTIDRDSFKSNFEYIFSFATWHCPQRISISQSHPQPIGNRTVQIHKCAIGPSGATNNNSNLWALKLNIIHEASALPLIYNSFGCPKLACHLVLSS